jgi:hypothetical protein
VANPGHVWGITENDEAARLAKLRSENYWAQKLLDYLIANKTKSGVAFTKTDYVSSFPDDDNENNYIPVNVSPTKSINVYFDFIEFSGALDLSLNSLNTPNNIGASIDFSDEIHTGFFLNFNDATNKKPLLKIWTKTYDEYETLFSYLNFGISQSLKDYIKKTFLDKIKEIDNPNVTDKCDKYDVIFETAPKYVFTDLTDDIKWSYFLSLNGCDVDRVGTDEYLSLVNIMFGITPAYLAEKINNNKKVFIDLLHNAPESKLFSLIAPLMNAFGANKTETELTALKNYPGATFDIKNVPEEAVGHVPLLSQGDWREKQAAFKPDASDFKYEFGYVIHSYRRTDRMTPFDSWTTPATNYNFSDLVQLDFTEDGEVTMPVFAAQEIFSRLLAKDKAVFINNMLGLMLPSYVGKVPNFWKLFRFKKTIDNVKIETIDELKVFLNSIDGTTTITQLETKGIQAFFRGTTRSKTTNNLFPGSPNSQAGGISTSTDPIKATIFSIESATSNGAYKGVLQIALPKNLKTITLSSPNNRVGLELEVIMSTPANNFAGLSEVEITVENARKIIKEVYNVDLPTRISTQDDARYLLETIPESSLQKAYEFYQKAIKYNIK